LREGLRQVLDLVEDGVERQLRPVDGGADPGDVEGQEVEQPAGEEQALPAGLPDVLGDLVEGRRQSLSDHGRSLVLMGKWSPLDGEGAMEGGGPAFGERGRFLGSASKSGPLLAGRRNFYQKKIRRVCRDSCGKRKNCGEPYRTDSWAMLKNGSGLSRPGMGLLV
jgi:hypothetical protein